jgi:predicted Zn-dependent peptidase
VLDEVADRGIEEDELERARGVVRASADYLLDSPFELADWFGRTEVLHTPKLLPDPRRETERFTSVQMDDVWRVIRNVLRPPNRYLAVVGPLAWRDKRQFETLFRNRTRDRASSTTA